MITYALLVSDGASMRCIHPAALGDVTRAVIDQWIASNCVDPATVASDLSSTTAEADQKPIPNVGAVAPLRALATDQLAPAMPVPQRDRLHKIAEAKGQGYTGNFCTHCQSARTKNNGACLVCEDCGQTTGCS